MESYNIIKYLTNEKKGASNLSSEELLDILRYALFNVMGISEEELLRVFCNGFLNKHSLYKYYKKINVPLVYSENKDEWVKSKLCPNYYKLDKVNFFNNIFFNTLKANSNKTLLEKYHNIPLETKAGRLMLDIVFTDVKSPTEYIVFASLHKNIMEKLIENFKLKDFYDTYCFSPVDFVFYSLTEDEKREVLKLYLTIKKEQKGPDFLIVCDALNSL